MLVQARHALVVNQNSIECSLCEAVRQPESRSLTAEFVYLRVYVQAVRNHTTGGFAPVGPRQACTVLQRVAEATPASGLLLCF